MGKGGKITYDLRRGLCLLPPAEDGLDARAEHLDVVVDLHYSSKDQRIVCCLLFLDIEKRTGSFRDMGTAGC